MSASKDPGTLFAASSVDPTWRRRTPDVQVRRFWLHTCLSSLFQISGRMSSCSSLLARSKALKGSCARSLRHHQLNRASVLSSSRQSSTLPASSSKNPDINDGSSVFPDLMKPDVLYDGAHSKIYEGPRSGRFAKVIVRNDPSYMVIDKELNDSIKNEGNAKDEDKDPRILIKRKLRDLNLHIYPLLSRRVTQQTGKGKRHRLYQLTVVGNGDGLVGYGEGKHEEMSVAKDKAITEAVRNMDSVSRFEQRTIWTNMDIKLGATRILMRPRPVGFGLHCNPNIHQVLKAAGIKDVSAKVWGSRNPINVIKATCMLIQSGNAPLAMGDGVGGKGRRLDVGSGMRSKESVERDRGRKLLDGRTW